MKKLQSDGYLSLCQLHRLTTTKTFEKKLSIYRPAATTYKENKERFETIPEENRKIPYITASRIVVVYPHDATVEEIKKALQFLLDTLDNRVAEDENSS